MSERELLRKIIKLTECERTRQIFDELATSDARSYGQEKAENETPTNSIAQRKTKFLPSKREQVEPQHPKQDQNAIKFRKTSEGEHG